VEALAVRATSLGLLVALLLGGAALGHAQAPECVPVDDFAKSRPGAFPADWHVRDEPGKTVYSVREENGLRFLAADARGLGIQAGRKFEWNLDAYPVLAWAWRPRQFPDGGDERHARTNDSVLAVYAVFPHWVPGTVRSLKYVWSAVVPKGTALTSSGGRTQVRVLRTGTDGMDQWIEERVNVREDYRRLFKTSSVPKPEGVAVLTDADDTESRARGDYAKLRVCRG
jgi:hypothetical protein